MENNENLVVSFFLFVMNCSPFLERFTTVFVCLWQRTDFKISVPKCEDYFLCDIFSFCYFFLAEIYLKFSFQRFVTYLWCWSVDMPRVMNPLIYVWVSVYISSVYFAQIFQKSSFEGLRDIHLISANKIY